MVHTLPVFLALGPFVLLEVMASGPAPDEDDVCTAGECGMSLLQRYGEARGRGGKQAIATELAQRQDEATHVEDTWAQKWFAHWFEADADADGRLSAEELQSHLSRQSAAAGGPEPVVGRPLRIANATASLLSRLALTAGGGIDATEAARAVAEAESLQSNLVARALAGQHRAGSAQHLEKVLTRKVADERCVDAGEGQTCVSGNSYVYCSAGKRLSAGETKCENERGKLSKCATNGDGLTRNYCDDPFCRNGKAYGDAVRRYCKGSSTVVKCMSVGPDAPPPETMMTCDQKVDKVFGCKTVTPLKCMDFGIDADCTPSGPPETKCDER